MYITLFGLLSFFLSPCLLKKAGAYNGRNVVISSSFSFFFSPGFFIWEISWVSAVNEFAMLFLFHPGHFHMCLSAGILTPTDISLFTFLSVNTWALFLPRGPLYRLSCSNHNVNSRFLKDKSRLSGQRVSSCPCDLLLMKVNPRLTSNNKTVAMLRLELWPITIYIPLYARYMVNF